MFGRVLPIFFILSVLSAAQTLTLDFATVPTPLTPQSLVTGDFNHDGKPDLAVTGSEGTIVILLGNGDGTFRTGQTITVAAPATRILRADFNGDGNPDLAVMVGNSGQVAILLGKSDGTFQAPADSGAKAPTGVFTPASNPTMMAGDVDGDGKVDLILGPYSMASDSVSVASASTMYVLLGNGDGTFHAPKASSIAPISYASARAVDFYNNGKTEVFLVGTHADYPNGSLLTGAADGALTESRFAGIVNDLGVYFALTAGDVQGNGRQGVIAAEQCASIPTGVYAFLNGSLTPATSMVPDICGGYGAPPGFMEAAIADMDGDGKPDLLLSDGFGMLYVTPGNGDGTFQGSKTGKFYTSAAPSSGGISGFDEYGSIATADFRGTGKLDVVMALAGKSVVMLRNGAGAAPAVPSGGVVSSASLGAIPAVAGGLASIFGSGFSYDTGNGESYPNALPTWLFGTAVTLNGSPIPLIWLSPTQVNVQIPWEDAGLTQATLVVTRNQLASQTITVQLAPAAPALFAMNGQGTGQAAALIAGSSTVAAPVGAFSTSRPAHPGEYISLYGTGLGPVVEPQPLVTGQSTPERDTPFQPLRYIYYPTVQTTTVSIGGVPAIVQFAGLAPDMIGVYQINVQIPASAPSGAAVPVVLSVGRAVANTVTLAIGPS